MPAISRDYAGHGGSRTTRARLRALLESGFDEQKQPFQLEESIHAALRQADTYDREVFESMGVKTIWLDRFDDIPDVIDAIAS